MQFPSVLSLGSVSPGRYLGMSVPVVNEIRMADNGTNFMKDVLTAYYLPTEFQARPPEPSDPDIRIVHRDAIPVITRYTTTLPNQTLGAQPLDLCACSRMIKVELSFHSRVFYGTTTEETISRQIGILWELLGNSEDVLQDRYMVATYENPSVPQHRNEIWFIRRGA